MYQAVTPRNAAKSGEKSSSPGVPLMFILLISAWLFDFQSSGQGQGIDIQAYFAAAYLFALIMLVIGDRTGGRRVQGLFAMVVTGLLYLGVGIGVGLVNGQDYYPILRNALNVAIYISAAFVTARMVVVTDPSRLRMVLSVLCLLYAMSSYLIFNFTSGGVDVEKVRFQIIGGSAIAALGYVTLAALFRLNKFELAAMAVNGIVLLLAITRSYLIVFAAQASVMIGQVRKVFSPRLILFGSMGLVALLGVMTYGQRQLLRWSDRMVGAGSDFSQYQTYYTRISEWEFMVGSWTQSVETFLFGSGIAARTLYYLPPELGGGTEFMIGFGHNQHLSMIFTAGVIGGLPMLLLQLFQGYLAWRFLRRVISYPKLRNDVVFLGAWGSTVILGHLAVNMVSATFSTRGSSLWYGIGVGLLLGAQAMFDPANRPRAVKPSSGRASRYTPA